LTIPMTLSSTDTLESSDTNYSVSVLRYGCASADGVRRQIRHLRGDIPPFQERVNRKQTGKFRDLIRSTGKGDPRFLSAVLRRHFPREEQPENEADKRF